jgi:hypothetical protein
VSKDDPDRQRKLVYHHLGWLLGELVEALANW